MHLTEQQQQAVENGEALPVHVGNSECVVIRKDILDLAGTVDDLPPDMARNHNHYLHGHPKK